ncbi:transcription and mRNA export factor ENY2-like [Carassius carassius]|uniref:transcription and mRNA export factor ENY2-like n=1 Tax=Carassius carassius TaxID=217509 RepID=UPI0028683F00|nr:transcription and mRNA export factor ENY2-like [Carassius carassius]
MNEPLSWEEPSIGERVSAGKVNGVRNVCEQTTAERSIYKRRLEHYAYFRQCLINISKESQMRAAINQKLIEMGERERLKELLRAKLIECGWRDQLKALCKEVIKEKGIENVTVEDLVAGVTHKGRALVPDSVKKELLQRIRAFLSQHST